MILCIGMMVADTLLRPVLPNIMSLDGCAIERPVRSQGGDAFNTASALAKLGMDTAIAGRIGRDPEGSFLLEKGRELGIDCSYVIIDSKFHTASSYVLVEKSGARHFVSDISIFNQLSADDIPEEAVRRSKVVYLGSACAMKHMNEGGAAHIFHMAKDFGNITVMDAAINDLNLSEDWMSDLGELLKWTDYFFPSMEEAAAITGKQDVYSIARCFEPYRLKGFGIKLGGDGVYVTNFQEERKIPAFKVNVVDTSGAGDTFMAGLIAGIVHGMDVFEGASFAASVAAGSVEHIGGAEGVGSYDEEYRRYHMRSN